MATSSFFDTFTFTEESEKKYFKRLAETEKNPPKRKHFDLFKDYDFRTDSK